MQPVVLLAVAAVWAAVIIPPLLRSRVENRPNSSVTDFRRQLSTLQRAVPTRSMVPMRGMARPLAQAPQRRQAQHGQHGHPGQMHLASGLPQPGARQHQQSSPAGQPGQAGHRQLHLHRVSQRELVRRRRANVLFVLVVTVGLTGFLAATTHNSPMTYIFALSFVSLCGYCYRLVQIRSLEIDRTYGEQGWFHAA